MKQIVVFNVDDLICGIDLQEIKEINKETRVLIQSFIKNLEMITKGGYHFFVSGD